MKTELTKQEKLNQILETAKEMVLAGVLLKNVKRHFTNLGVSSDLADKMVSIAEFNANEYLFNKAK
jgi:hypothetical protein